MSTNIAVIFPGQGSQHVGMGKALVEKYETAGKVFKDADEILGFPISRMIFDGPEEELTLTKNSQPAIYVTSFAALSVLRERALKLKPKFYAGLSLGEYTAYAAAGAFTFADGLRLVRRRGELMQKCAEDNPGTMASIIGLPLEKIEELCGKTAQKHPVNVANINSPGQTVISGSIVGVREAASLASQAGAKKVIELNVSGAFHSSLMQDASMELAESLALVEISRPQIPVVCNVLAREVPEPDGIRKTLAEQVTKPVRWQQSVEYMSEKGATLFIECGCGKVLRGLVKRIVPAAATIGVEDGDSLDEAVEALNKLI